ncbi:discoidin domain-containing protein [Aequorivita todarodis]|uniref:galactose-binding domain-containing protein n=1 Tax=Aequorivita todarodis TaxID=2036821 RepID=UPI002350A030|nr:discoidin domain-containing protein [Aequorivita todarodis]MDC8000175.1 discoidin domain-containing protein [Aequorivita todarodis]
MKTISKFVFIIGLIAFVGFPSLTAQTTSVYVSAHPDDWQLFMNPNAYNSIKGTNEKVVFIHTTAGDAGNGITNNYYLAREEGSLRAIRFMSNTFTNQGAPGTNMNQTTVNVNGHQILKLSYRNAVIYFLRLPDGNYRGTGYSGTNDQSLQKLYNGSIPSISAIDGTATYSSLADLENTLKSIVQTESIGNIKFNLADHDASINPDDHSDHVHSSLIMQDVANSIGGVTLNLYSEYDTAIRPVNVFNNDFMVNAGTWGATASGISDNSFFSTWDNDHNVWLYRQYFRTVPANNYPIASVVATDANAGENPLDTGTFTVSLNAVNTGGPIVVNYTISGTATPGADYTSLPGTVTIATGQQSKTITVTPIDDTEVEPLETVVLTLASGTGYNVGSPATATVNISSEDVIPPGTNIALLKPTTASNGFSTKDKAVDGNYSKSNYWQGIPYPQWWQVDLGNEFDISKLVVITYYGNNRYYQYDIQASTDGNNWTTVVDFNANTTPATSQGNTFNLNNPKARYLRVNMNYNSANFGVHIIEFEAYGVLSGSNNPQATITATDASAAENPLDNGTFTVSLDAVNNNGPLTVNYTVGGTASSGSDYTALSGTVTIPNGQQSGTITVIPVDDTEVEPVETVILTLSSGAGYTVGTPFSATVNIISDDLAPPSGNLALNKPTSSSSGSETASSKAVDGIYTIDNWWGASPFPQWWSVDLGAEYDLSQLVVFNYYDGSRYYQYDIQGSLDGTTWTTLVDFNANTTPATNQGNSFNLNNPSARYLRVNMNYNSANIGVHIIEFEAYGTLTQNSGRNASNQTNSSVGKLSEASKKYALSVYPNPSKYGNPIKVGLQLPEDRRASVAIFDIQGKMIANKEFDLKKGANEVEMPTDYFSAGMLIVKVDIQGEIMTKKVFLE